MKSLLVTGTDTDVGKTWISALIIRLLRNDNLSVGAYKPVCSGAQVRDGQPEWEDVQVLADSLQFDGDISAICPQRFLQPLAPNVAARLQETSVCEDTLEAGFRQWETLCEYLVVEGVGGLLCPISDQVNVADFFKLLDRPVLIVAANRLGVLNHTALTIEVARNRGLTIAGVVLNDVTERIQDDNDIVRKENVNELIRICDNLPLWHCQYLGSQFGPVNEHARCVTLSTLFG